MNRLDVFLVTNGFVKSRERAKAVIKAGKVKVKGKVCTKPSAQVLDSDDISCEPDELSFVGRGGLKLNKALDSFCVDVTNAVCADIGASTGGFTQCLLEHGARKVYAIDVGHGQLDSSLVSDPRVVNFEGVNARELKSDLFDETPGFASIDVSFISLGLIIKPVCDVLTESARIIALIKPQFEAGKNALNKNGVVKDKKVHMNVLENITSFFSSCDLILQNLIASPITGGDGNIEYLALLTKDRNAQKIQLDIKNIVTTAFSTLNENRR